MGGVTENNLQAVAAREAARNTTNGQFGEQQLADPGTAVVAVLPQPALSAATVEAMAGYRGRFVSGYTSDDIQRLRMVFLDAVEFSCVWDGFDDDGYHGNSEIVGRVGGGPWRELSLPMWEFLFEPETDDINPPSVWLSDRLADSVPDDMSGDGLGNLAPALPAEELCSRCGCRHDGVSFDGLCASCAEDKSECPDCGRDTSGFNPAENGCPDCGGGHNDCEECGATDCASYRDNDRILCDDCYDDDGN